MVVFIIWDDDGASDVAGIVEERDGDERVKWMWIDETEKRMKREMEGDRKKEKKMETRKRRRSWR